MTERSEYSPPEKWKWRGNIIVSEATFLLEEPRDLPVYAEHLHQIWLHARLTEKSTRHVEATVIHRLHQRGFSATEVRRLLHVTNDVYRRRLKLITYMREHDMYHGYWDD